MTHPTQERREFFERLKYTIIDSSRDELDEILRTLIRKDNAREFYEELFQGCQIDKGGELVRRGFFSIKAVSVSLEYAMYTLLAYAPKGFKLKNEIRSIRFIAPAGSKRRSLRFPRRLDYFPQLEQLGVVGWSCGKVPRELAQCNNLKYLSLRDNDFTEFPEPLLRIPNLTHLDLNLNSISSLPGDISQMDKLRKLSLKGNRLVEIPVALTTLKNLEYLDLSCNVIKVIPPSFGDLKGLKQLEISYNELRTEEEAKWEQAFPLSSSY